MRSPHLLEEARLNADADDPKLALVRDAYRWMIENAPVAREPTLVQGDAQIANMIFEQGKIAAVIDWELAYLGHNEADLALIVFITESLKIIDKYVEGTPSEAEYIARYEDEAGAPVEHWAYFQMFTLFKIQAVLLSTRSFTPSFDTVWNFYADELQKAWVKACR